MTPADIDARLIKEATTPESRHAWIIEVTPANDAGTGTPATPRRRPPRPRPTRRSPT